MRGILSIILTLSMAYPISSFADDNEIKIGTKITFNKDITNDTVYNGHDYPAELFMFVDGYVHKPRLNSDGSTSHPFFKHCTFLGKEMLAGEAWVIHLITKDSKKSKSFWLCNRNGDFINLTCEQGELNLFQSAKSFKLSHLRHQLGRHAQISQDIVSDTSRFCNGEE